MIKMGIVDQFLIKADSILRTVSPKRILEVNRINEEDPTVSLSLSEKKHAAGLMRVNHAGEVCAQALYIGQSITACREDIKAHMIKAAEEEERHLYWCAARLKSLGSKTSILDPFWYSGSLLLGMVAGLAGDKWSLGFVVETEKQVILHLRRHLMKLPPQDEGSKKIINQMLIDEEQHAIEAEEAGAAVLPATVKKLMHYTATVMTFLSYYI